MKDMLRIDPAAILAAAFAIVLAAGAIHAEGKDQATREYIEANKKMHHGMTIEYTGDADLDFVRGMIPHHQGAVDMAKTQLTYGTDEELKSLSRAIIEAQEREIAFMRTWLESRK